MKNLENEKRRLETKLKILREQEDYNGKVEYLVKQLENELEQQIESLKSDQNKLQPELQEIQDEVDDTKKRSANHRAADFTEHVDCCNKTCNFISFSPFYLELVSGMKTSCAREVTLRTTLLCLKRYCER